MPALPVYARHAQSEKYDHGSGSAVCITCGVLLYGGRGRPYILLLNKPKT
jgi:hypothetical protein